MGPLSAFLSLLKDNPDEIYWKRLTPPLPGIVKALEIQSGIAGIMLNICRAENDIRSVCHDRRISRREACEMIVREVPDFDSSHLPRLMWIARNQLPPFSIFSRRGDDVIGG